MKQPYRCLSQELENLEKRMAGETVNCDVSSEVMDDDDDDGEEGESVDVSEYVGAEYLMEEEASQPTPHYVHRSVGAPGSTTYSHGGETYPSEVFSRHADGEEVQEYSEEDSEEDETYDDGDDERVVGALLATPVTSPSIRTAPPPSRRDMAYTQSSAASHGSES